MAGRPRKPTNLKLLQGTFRSDRAERHEPKPTIEIPAMPDHLSEEAQKEWHRITPELFKLGLVSKIDFSLIVMHCESWAIYLEAKRKRIESGLIIRTAQGNAIENPFLSVEKRMIDIMRSIAIEFGMSPASRTKIDASPLPAGVSGSDQPIGNENPFAQLGQRA